MNTSSAPQTETQRLDKWLWFVRLVKTRSLATQTVSSGKVRVNEVKVVKPAHKLAPGDVVTVMIAHQPRIYKMKAAGNRRGPACEAALLYEDLSPPPENRKRPGPSSASPGNADNREAVAIPQPKPGETAAKAPTRAPGMGRPTKKDRRAMQKLKR